MTAQDPDEDVRRLSGEALREGDATGWFERLYAEAAGGQAVVPWDRRAPHPLLVEWIEQRPALCGSRTLVVGSGLGDDAAYLAAQGYRVIAFDISHSAIEAARRRSPTSPVDFRVADLLNPPAEWREHFDLVWRPTPPNPSPYGSARRSCCMSAASSRRAARCWP
jgi:SAM-dependent methyltransferase